MQTFWNEEERFMTETTITNVTTGGRSGIGSAPLTVSVLNFDPALGCDAATFQPCSDRALSSLKVVGDAYVEMFPINRRLDSDQFPYFGFFLEDQLYGGQVSPAHKLSANTRNLCRLNFGSRCNTSRLSTSQSRFSMRLTRGKSLAASISPGSLSSSSGNSTLRPYLGPTKRARPRMKI
jgi:hypothetical protein